jgi:hypothetical protein
LVEPDLTRPIRPYQTSEIYSVGDRIDHQSFGTGIILREPTTASDSSRVADARNSSSDSRFRRSCSRL